MAYYIIDIEGTSIDPNTSVPHCVVINGPDGVEAYHDTSFAPKTGNLAACISRVQGLLASGHTLVGHNILKYDIPNLMVQLGLTITPEQMRDQIRDSLLWAKILWPDIDSRKDLPWPRKNIPKYYWNSYSLGAFGARLKCPKGDPGGDWSAFTQQMLTYCIQDTEVNKALLACLLDPAFNHGQELPEQCLQDEHEYAWLMFLQMHHGWPFDLEQAHKLHATLTARKDELYAQLEGLVEPTVTYGKKPLYFCHPEWPGKRWGTKGQVEDYLKANPRSRTLRERISEIHPGPPKKTVTPWNPGSRDQVKALLYSKYDWQPRVWADKGGKNQEDYVTPEEYESYKEKGWHEKIDYDVLDDLGEKYPELAPLSEYFYVSKVLSMLSGGKAAHMQFVGPDMRVHGAIDTAGALGGRCTHSQPNVAQVPACNKKRPLNAEFRKCYSVSPGYVLIGFDASALEYRLMGHYGYALDGGFIARLVDDPNKDIHWEFAKKYGLVDVPENTPRDESNKEWESARSGGKSLTYGIPYGAQAKKVARMLGKTEREAKELLQYLEVNLPGMIGLRNHVTKAVEARGTKTQGKFGPRYVPYTGYIKGLDGRLCTIRSAHASLNTLLQGAGGVFMKSATRFFMQLCIEAGLSVYGYSQRRWMLPHAGAYDVALLGAIHDEAQVMVRQGKEEQVGALVHKAFDKATKYHKLRCPIRTNVKVGANWAETH